MARKRSKRYRQARKQAPAIGTKLPLEEAVRILKGFPATKFDETVEVALRLGIDPKKPDQLVRGSFSLPHGLGVEKRVIAFVDSAADAEAAKAAGAVDAGADELVKRIEGGWLDFDVAIAHPKAMRFVGKLGRVLGPQGKMPSPKSGTVTENVVQAVGEFKGGKISFKNDPTGNVHAAVGKRSFPPEKLVENASAFIEHVKGMRPSSAKGTYLQHAAIAATMSPGIELLVAT